MILDDVSYMTISSRGGDILTLIILVALKALEALLVNFKIFLITLKTKITRLTAFLNLIVAAEAIIKYIKV